MTDIYVGTSELPGRTFGKPQTMEQGAGLQVIGLLAKRTALGLSRITVNEGIRSRPDQDLCWVEYQNGTGPRAAPPYTSIHDPSRGGAVDFGGAGGAVLTAEEHAWLVANGPAYGVIWTGAGFDEWWHFEADRSRATIIVPASTTAPASVGTTITLTPEEIMASRVIRIDRKPKRPYDSYLVNLDARTAMPIGSDVQEATLQALGAPLVHGPQSAAILQNFQIVTGNFK